MPAPLTHFAINADDVERARAFYAVVFGWEFRPWGPPGFFHIDTGSNDAGHPIGALQSRRDFDPDHPTIGFECTVGVDDLATTLEVATSSGAEILIQPTTIDDVGTLAFLRDPEGNIVGVMDYQAT